ncbi:MAG: hypothetical protein CSA55_04355 [Ilumatobacter coccineus]|uniref:Thiamine pyrimidine synthase n=1 Tax=Ilumatobacter coccineus TaxID=467094 RepID=A0A2G6K8P7_9ACTN|nr:MAG: hypothetical protein CSA55_04355 [Ilumatobacter coccineus]
MSAHRILITSLAALVISTAGCGHDAPTSTLDPVPPVVAGEAIPTERCDANRQAGPITFVTGFDYAAAASIIEVIAAETAGYYDDLCLDVTLVPGFSTSNYPLVASGQAQFASGGSFSETVAFGLANEADLAVVTVAGAKPIETLLLKPEATSLDDVAGNTIGVKGKLPPGVEIMLSQAGLHEGEEFTTIPVDGFDPVAHMSIDETIGIPGWRSFEPAYLSQHDVPFVEFAVADAGVPGSFGVIFTSREFADAHPSAVEDFARASMRGLADVIADPSAAASHALALAEANGNPNFLSFETESARAKIEATLIVDALPDGMVAGTPLVDRLQDELDAYAETGLFGEATPPAATEVIIPIIDTITDDGTIIWPG